MSLPKEIRLAEKAAAQQREALLELEALRKSVERCARTVLELKGDLEAVNAKYPNPRTSEQDVAFLTALLKCAKKKFHWEKQVESLKRRAPTVFESVTRVMNDPQQPPAEELRASILAGLRAIQSALDRVEEAQM